MSDEKLFQDCSHLPYFMAEVVVSLSKMVGPPPDQIRMVLCLIIAIPLGFLHKKLPSATVKHIYSFGLGFFFCFFTTGISGILNPLISSSIVYLILLIMPKRQITALIVFIFSMTYMSVAHINRMLTDYYGWNLDFTTFQMIITLKLSMFAYNYVDGFKKEDFDTRLESVNFFLNCIDEYDKANEKAEREQILKKFQEKFLSLGEKLSKSIGISSKVVEGFKNSNLENGIFLKVQKGLKKLKMQMNFRKEKSFEKLPNPLEYFSYIFFFPSVLVGPGFEFKEYIEFTNLSLFKKYDKNLNESPSTFLAAMRNLGNVAIVFFFFSFGPKFPQGGFVNTEEYAKYNFAYRIGYLLLSTSIFRMKYYFGWYIAETAIIATGFPYNGKDKNGKHKWDRVKNGNWWLVELGPNLPSYTNNWNMGVNHWAKHYVYFRLEDTLGSRFLANILTKFTVAFWHGFYPTYYLFFLTTSLINYSEDNCSLLFYPIFYDTKTKKAKSIFHGFVYKLFSTFFVAFTMDYLGLGFIVLRLDWTYEAYKNLYFSGHILLVITSILGYFIKSSLVKKSKTK